MAPPEWNSFFQPTFDWIQVEVTSHCNAACTYCPRTVYRCKWQNRHLSMDIFEKLVPVFKRTRHIHLQGWGEPLLNPHFFEMAAAAKAAGCRVGTTTNAMLLDEVRISQLVESRVDIVALSSVDTREEENDRIRKGTSLKKVLEAVRALSREKKRRKVQTPQIHIAFLLFRSGLKTLNRLPSLIEGLGVRDVVISTLDFSPSEELLSEVLRPDTAEDYEIMRPVFDELAAECRKQGLGIHYHLPSPGHGRMECSENVGRAACVSSDGMVTPCVYTNLDIPDAFHFRGGATRVYRRLAFGNAGKDPLSLIWRAPSYKAFRRSFRKGKLLEPCRECPKLR